MADISSRHQRKIVSDYNRKQMDELNSLYQQATQMSAPTPVTPEGKPGVVSSIASGSVHGVKKAVHEMFNSLDELSTFVARIPDSKAPDRHNFSNVLDKFSGINKQSIHTEEKDKGTAYGISSGIAQFVTAFLPINRVAGSMTKGLKLSKVAGVGLKMAQGAAAGGAASAVGFDPYEQRLSNMIQAVPAIKNPLTEYLAASPGDSKATARMKNGVENALLGIGFDLGIEGAKGLFSAVKAFKAAKTLKGAGKEGEEALAAAQEVLARESKNIRDLKGGITEADAVIQPKSNDLVIDANAKDSHFYSTEGNTPIAEKPAQGIADAENAPARPKPGPVADPEFGPITKPEPVPTEATAEIQPKAAELVADPENASARPKAGLVADPEFGPVETPQAPTPTPTEADAVIQPKAADALANPEVLPKDLTEDEIMSRLAAASKEGRVSALSKLEPERAIEDITKEVDTHLAAVNTARAEGRSIEVIPEISGERVTLPTETPEGALKDYPEGMYPKAEVPQGSLDIPQLLPKYSVEGIPEEFQSSILDASGRPHDIRTLPVIDEALLPPKIHELAGNHNTTASSFIDSLGSLVNNEKGGVSTGALAPMASASVGGSSGLFVDYNGDGKVAGWEDIGIGMLIGTGGYVAAKTLRRYVNGSTEEQAVAHTEIHQKFQQQIDDFKSIEESYQDALKGSLSQDSRKQVEHSLNTVRQSREAMERLGANPAKLDAVLNKAWVREKYKPLVKIPEGKSEAIVQALRNGDLEAVSTAVGKDFNLSGIQAPEDLKEAIDGLTNLISEHIPEETAKMTRGVVSHEATIEGANELGVNLHNVNMLSQDTRKLSERLLAARVAMNSIKTPLLELTDQILNHSDPPAELLMKFREMTSLAAAVQAEVKGSQSEVARALNSMKIAADTVRMDFDSVSRMMEQQGGKRQMVSAVQKLKEIMREGDQVKVNRYLRGIAANPSLRFLNELHRTVLLSNPITHAANMSGNFLTAIVNAGEAALSGVFSGRGLGDVKALVEGLAQKDTWSDAIRLAKRAWTTSQSTIDPLISKVEGTELAHGISYDTFKQTYVGQGVDYLATALGIDGALGKGVDASGKFLRTTFDALGAEDEFFKVLNYQMSLHRESYLEAYRTAVSEGLEGGALAKRVGVLKAQLVEAPSETIFEKALHTTRVNTFTDNPTGILGSMNSFVAKHPTLQLFIPFTKTPTNLINYVFDRVPGLTLYQQEVRDVLVGGSREQKAELMARWSTGGLLMSTALGLASAGLITGGGDREDNAKRISGWQPYSIKVGDTYYSYNRLDPISSLLGLAADTYDITNYALDEGDAGKASTAALIAVTRNLTSKTMLKGFTELLDAISQGDKKLPAFAKNFGLSWIPAGVGAAERVTDPVLRDTITVMDQVKAKIPGLSRTLPPRRDVFGEPVVPEGNLGPDMLSPVAVSTATKDPVRQMFADLGIDTKSDLKGMQQVDKVPLSVDQHSRFVEIRGKMLKQSLDQLVGNQQFQHLPDNKDNPKSKQELIRTIMGNTKTAAKGKLFQEFPEILDAVKARHQEQAEELQQAQQQ